MREPDVQTRDLPVTGQLIGVVELFSCAVGLVLVVAGQIAVDVFWPANRPTPQLRPEPRPQL